MWTRSAIAALGALVLLAGCPSDALQGDVIDDEPPGELACEQDTDCTPAGSSCCECPTYALPASSGWADSCEDVSCDPATGCPDTRAVCAGGSCVLQCTPIRCDVTCAGGFAADEFGCLVCPASSEDCTPISGPAPGCQLDSDCVQVPADCCGCARGGADTAVPAGEVDDFLGGFECGDTQSCPEVDICDPDLVPRCIAGTCQLGAQPGDYNGDAGTGCDGDAGCNDLGLLQFCGTPDYPPCPDGQVCILNDPEANEASLSGVGVCQPGS